MTTRSPETDTSGPSLGSHLLGVVYVVLLLAATGGGLFASFRLNTRMFCMDEGVIPPVVLPVVLACLGVAAIPLLSLMPALRDRVPAAYRVGAVVVPFIVLCLYGVIMIWASLFAGLGSRTGSWTARLLPVIDLAPLLTLVVASAVAAIRSRRSRPLVITIIAFLAIISAGVTAVALTRATFWC